MNKETVSALNELIRVCRDSQEGFRVAAESVRNRGLKTLFKSFAQQRAEFANELQEEIRRLDGTPRQGGSTLAGLHRGWINIKAAMTIGAQRTENGVLEETQRGERVARRTYAQALEKELPDDTEALVRRQHQSILRVGTQIERMSGQAGLRMVVRLFDAEDDVQQAIARLTDEGFSEEAITRIPLTQEVAVYDEDTRRQSVGESAGAGALLGLLVGLLIGLAGGLGMIFVPGMNLGMEVGFPETLIVGGLVGAGIGAVFGALIGALIGTGVVEEDAYLYADSLAHGNVLLCVETARERADEAATIMLQVNAASAGA